MDGTHTVLKRRQAYWQQTFWGAGHALTEELAGRFIFSMWFSKFASFLGILSMFDNSCYTSATDSSRCWQCAVSLINWKLWKFWNAFPVKDVRSTLSVDQKDAEMYTSFCLHQCVSPMLLPPEYWAVASEVTATTVIPVSLSLPIVRRSNWACKYPDTLFTKK